LDAEYELDRFMGDLPWDWRDRFRGSASGFQTSFGSLNIRHFYIEQTLKVRFPVKREKLWFRFLHQKQHGLERQTTETRLEVEYSPFSSWFFSVVGEPAFHKSETDIGLAARWGPDEGRSVKFTYLWPDFDTNYAFRNRSISEGFEEFYHRFPQEARLAAVWAQERLSLAVQGRLTRPWVKVHRDLRSPFTAHEQNGSWAEAAADLRHRQGPWTLALEGGTERVRESLEFQPADPVQDKRLVQERSFLRGSVERRLSRTLDIRLGSGFVRFRNRAQYPAQPSLNQLDQTLDRISFVYLRRSFTPTFQTELGYLYDRQWHKDLQGFSSQTFSRSHNRGTLGFLCRFSENASFRLIGTAELDQTESEHFFSFDGGTAQFQTVF
jgi:hypothetical protein